MNEGAESRDSRRRRTLLSGVVFDTNNLTWECSVTDMSQTGVRVTTSIKPNVGSSVSLQISKFKTRHRFEVMWARNGELGLRNIDTALAYDAEIKGFLDSRKILKEKPRPPSTSDTSAHSPSEIMPEIAGNEIIGDANEAPTAAEGAIATAHQANQAMPVSISRLLQFNNGYAVGTSDQWRNGGYCKIVTNSALVGSTIFDIHVASELGEAMAVAEGEPGKPLVELEDLLEAHIIGLTPKAATYGVRIGMTGRQATELFLLAEL